jgi:hypothetical protein
VIALFGDEQTLKMFCGGYGPEALIDIYCKQLQEAQQLGAEYVVFHASQADFQGIYDWTFPWTWEQTIDDCAELLNRVFDRIQFSIPVPSEMCRATFQTQGVVRENVAEPVEKTAEHRLALLKDARFLLSLRDELAAEEQRLADQRMAMARNYLAELDDPLASRERDDA